jgi:D-beta-D-heptose 7-phosphate kinase/D-beta-D-heptose 1-phosphate adenosyltransferase
MKGLGGEVVAIDELAARRASLGRLVMTSGGFDPIHPGHISCIIESAAYGDALVVVVNGDSFLREKKGRPFQDCETRCLIVSGIRGVDFVVPYDAPGDQTVSGALEVIRPAVFTKGGDRVDASSIPEWEVCSRLGIEVVTGVGLSKEWSSSWFLEEWSRSDEPSA